MAIRTWLLVCFDAAILQVVIHLTDSVRWSATTAPLGRGRQAYPTTSGYPCMSYLSAVQGLPQVAPSGQLSANAPEFIPRGATHLRSMRRLWEPRWRSFDVQHMTPLLHEEKAAGCLLILGKLNNRCVIRESPMTARQVSSSTCRMYSATGSVADFADRPVTSRSEPADGCLVEYQKDSKSGLALLLKKDGKRNWAAVDSRCARLPIDCCPRQGTCKVLNIQQVT